MERHGTAHLFMVCEPMMGWRRVEVTQHRTAVDDVHLLKTGADVDDAHAPNLLLI